MKTALALALLAAPAFADTPDSSHIRQQFTPALARACLDSAVTRVDQPLRITQDLQYNETLSRVVYDQLYWQHGERGVAFTAPTSNGTLACYYSLAKSGLAFDYAQALPRQL